MCHEEGGAMYWVLHVVITANSSRFCNKRECAAAWCLSSHLHLFVFTDYTSVVRSTPLFNCRHKPMMASYLKWKLEDKNKRGILRNKMKVYPWLALSVVYFWIMHGLGRLHYVWDDDEKKGEGETRCRLIACSSRKAPRGPLGLTSSSDGRIAINSIICLLNIHTAEGFGI